MPVITSSFEATGLFRNPHFSTIYSSKVRKVRGLRQVRETIELPDGDFIDIDWSFSSIASKGDSLSRKRIPTSSKIALLLHGLEGDAQRPYMRGMASLLVENGYDVAAINFRGCSGVQNRLYKSYHSGETGDLRFVVKEIARRGYHSIGLYGVSLGGNVVLKYLGEQEEIPPQLKVASCIGVPVDLKISLEQLVKRENFIYRTSFLIHLRAKYRKKMVQFPNKMSRDEYRAIKSLKDFDDLYTAPAHGFDDALNYYAQASSYRFLEHIDIPTLVLNAKNDSFLHGNCYPITQAENSDYLHLEMPDHGGHVGFYLPGKYYYNERRTLEFFKKNID